MKERFFKIIKILYPCLLFYYWFPPVQFVNIFSTNYKIIKVIVLSVSIIFSVLNPIIKNDNVTTKKRYLLIWGYAIILYIQTYIYNVTELLNSLVYILTVLSIFYFFKDEKNIEKIHYFLLPASIYMFFLIISMFKVQGIPSLEISNYIEYFLGGKFKIGYLGILWEFLFLIYQYKKNGKNTYSEFIICFVILFLMNLKVNCVSAIVCSTILFILLLLKNKILNFLQPKIIYISTIVLNLFTLFIYPKLKDLPIIQWIFNYIFHRKTTITGRTNIYTTFFSKFKEEIVFGRGYNNEVVKSALKYSNAQNGFLHEMCRVGFLGMSLIASIIFISFSNSYHKILKKDYLYLLAWIFIIVFLCDALIEISFNLYFFFILSICFSCVKTPKENLKIKR